MKKYFMLLSLLSATACTLHCSDITGQWVMPIPGMENSVQGIDLRPRGVAQSINMATLKYDTWYQESCDKISIHGISIGNGQTIEFTETYLVSMPNKNTLNLTQDNGYTQTYTRK